MRVYSGDELMIMNLGTEPCNVEKHQSLVMFGKGSFMRLQADEAQDNDIPSTLESHTSLVIYNNHVVTLGSLIEKQRSKDPSLAKVLLP